MLYYKDVFRLMVLAYNCVSVLLIFIELLRYSYQGSPLGEKLNSLFIGFADSRENKNRLMLTHLYLLLGCSMPVCLTFILLDGGFMNGEHMVFAYSGIMILGVGDTAAALYGKEFGVSLWRQGIHKKS